MDNSKDTIVKTNLTEAKVISPEITTENLGSITNILQEMTGFSQVITNSEVTEIAEMDRSHIVEVDISLMVAMDRSHMVEVDIGHMVETDRLHMVEIDRLHMVEMDISHMVEIDRIHIVEVGISHMVEMDISQIEDHTIRDHPTKIK